eukprot:TRINITY_DN79481_c0_g1_i1.p1 TRINITY_DN79481_c0_g1~~TRINITY_DN79481_c0_g1_i1.p1  ORF type:complete len:447 (-),score=83.02 TRINITY_DN79481_c0_g1_i1:67-1407(-)
MDAASWLSSLSTSQPEGSLADIDVKENGQTGRDDSATGDETAINTEAEALEELLAAGFERDAAVKALTQCGGDVVAALAALAKSSARQGGTKRLLSEPKEISDLNSALAVQPIEVEGIQCALTKSQELILQLPGDCLRPGPVVGHKQPDGGIEFNGMDDWLYELYEGHKPRPATLPPSFNIEAAFAAMEDGAPYVWDDFASESEIRAANHALEAMFGRRELTRGSRLWVDECAEGGHARNRRALEGQHRDDACGFWDIQGGEPPPPDPILTLFRRLEASAEQLRAKFGWPLMCSRLGMGAVYDGQGACYQQHRDNEWQRHLRPLTPNGLSVDLGSAGCKRRRMEENSDSGKQKGAWMNFRELTMLAYVNLPEKFGDHEEGKCAGGRLRCYVDTKRGDLDGSSAREHLDLAPVGGRAVIFRSRELLHEVLPSFDRRYCLTLWICSPH